ncbi:hypothetical protein BJ944DRAFT_244280 [Cunninghamella echinulata]|nr:hypothetical protein BJ944DRAFT_244280 [Cunninghamella echinulata]
MLTSIATSHVPENHTLESQTSLEATATDVYNKKKQKPRNSNKTTEAAGKMTTRKSSSLISNNNPDILHTTEIQLVPTNDKIITNTEQQQEEVKEVNEKENIIQEDTCTKDNFVMNTNETDKPSTTLDIHSSTNQIMDADNILPSPISQKSESVNLTETNISKDEDHVMTDKDSEQFHQEALQALTRIEIQFAKLRQKVFEEKMKELQNELIMIENGK